MILLSELICVTGHAVFLGSNGVVSINRPKRIEMLHCFKNLKSSHGLRDLRLTFEMFYSMHFQLATIEIVEGGGRESLILKL